MAKNPAEYDAGIVKVSLLAYVVVPDLIGHDNFPF